MIQLAGLSLFLCLNGGVEPKNARVLEAGKEDGKRTKRSAVIWSERHRKNTNNTAQVLKKLTDDFFLPDRHGWIEQKTAWDKTFTSDF
jgi:hypothetical protein